MNASSNARAVSNYTASTRALERSTSSTIDFLRNLGAVRVFLHLEPAVVAHHVFSRPVLTSLRFFTPFTRPGLDRPPHTSTSSPKSFIRAAKSLASHYLMRNFPLSIRTFHRDAAVLSHPVLVCNPKIQVTLSGT